MLQACSGHTWRIFKMFDAWYRQTSGTSSVAETSNFSADVTALEGNIAPGAGTWLAQEEEFAVQSSGLLGALTADSIVDFCGNLTFDYIVVLVAKAITSRQRLKDYGWIDAAAEQAQTQ